MLRAFVSATDAHDPSFLHADVVVANSMGWPYLRWMIWMYAGFVALVLALLALDLGVFHRKAHVVSVKEALGWSAFWIALGLAFAGFIYAGYENHWLGLGLSPDRMTLAPQAVEGVGIVYNDGAQRHGQVRHRLPRREVPGRRQHLRDRDALRLLRGPRRSTSTASCSGASWAPSLMRGVMIAVGAQLIQRFTWIIYVFGAFLILTGIKMLLLKAEETDPNRNIVVRLTRRLLPDHGALPRPALLRPRRVGRLPRGARSRQPPRRRTASSTRPGRASLLATPLFLALVMVEFTDVIFAVDSIPAIFAITADPFLVFTSNVFAILGLRSLYFALAGMIDAVPLPEGRARLRADGGRREDDDPRLAEGPPRPALQPLPAGRRPAHPRRGRRGLARRREARATEPAPPSLTGAFRDRTCRLAPGAFRVRIRAEVLTRSRRRVRRGSQPKEAQT